MIGRVTCNAEIGVFVPIPTFAFGKRTLLLLIVVVPLEAPTLSVVAFALKRFPVEEVVVIEPPFTAIFASNVVVPEPKNE